MDKKKLGLIGLGTWAENGHLPIYNQRKIQEMIALEALCSRSIEKARAWATKYGAKTAYDNFEEMLSNSALDILVVCTPDHLHPEYVIKGLERGCDVIVEKPMATSVQDCYDIMDKTNNTNRVFPLFHKRSDSLWAQAADLVASGTLGNLQMGTVLIENSLEVSAGNYFRSPMSENTTPNWFLGSHMYDLIRYLTNVNPVEVNARQYFGKLKSLGIDSPDAIKADMTMENGASISFLLSWNLPEKSPSITKQEILLHFENGELVLDGTKRGFYLNDQKGWHHINPYFLRNSGESWTGYGAQYLEEVIHALYDDNYKPMTRLATSEDGLWATAIAQAVEHSCAQKKTVEIKVAR